MRIGIVGSVLVIFKFITASIIIPSIFFIQSVTGIWNIAFRGDHATEAVGNPSRAEGGSLLQRDGQVNPDYHLYLTSIYSGFGTGPFTMDVVLAEDGEEGITPSEAQIDFYNLAKEKAKILDMSYNDLEEALAPRGRIRYLPELKSIDKAGVQFETLISMNEYDLPDLRTLPAYNLRLIQNDQNGTRQLRFSNSIWNAGDGPLVLKGVYDPRSEVADVFQVLYHDGQPTEEKQMGNFYFHEEHNHWHWEGFSLYEIWSIDDDGNLAELLSESGKVGYCIRDDSRIDGFDVRFENPNIAVSPGYRSCGVQQQGLSVGWVDTYAHNTPGQTLDITGIPEGIYALRSIANPDGYILEADTTHNEAITYFQLESFRVSVVKEFNR
jgi:hypothetical protein